CFRVRPGSLTIIDAHQVSPNAFNAVLILLRRLREGASDSFALIAPQLRRPSSPVDTKAPLEPWRRSACRIWRGRAQGTEALGRDLLVVDLIAPIDKGSKMPLVQVLLHRERMIACSRNRRGVAVHCRGSGGARGNQRMVVRDMGRKSTG